jgi:hypothetical protein
MLVNLMIVISILLIINQIFLAYSKNNVESYMAVVPMFSPKYNFTKKPVFSPTNNFYPHNHISQDFDPDSVITWYS